MKSVIVILLLAMAATASAEIYTWKDKRGTEFFTNSLYEIPERYRSRAKVLDVATGKKIPLSAAPAAAQTGTSAAPAQPGQPVPSPQPSPQQPPAVIAPPPPGAPGIPETRSRDLNNLQPRVPGTSRALQRRHNRSNFPPEE